MVETGYSEYNVVAPEATRDALRDEFTVVQEDDDGNITLVAPSGEEMGLLSDTPPPNPVQEFMEESNLDFGMLASQPVRKPSGLPESLREPAAVRDLIGDVGVANVLEEVLGGTDLREYSLQSRVRFDVFDGVHPISTSVIRESIELGLTKEEEQAFPTAEVLLAFDEDLQTEFPSLRTRGIGWFRLPTEQYPEGRVLFDGIYVEGGDTYPERSVSWLQERFGGEASEFMELNHGIRLWWD